MNAYQEDLAYIHESGYVRLANGAAATLLEQLALSTDRNGPIIDLGCGGGTLAEQLCAAGYNVIGYDLSEAMVQMARQRVPAATFRHGSFVDVDFPTCTAVTAIGEVFNYLFDDRNGSSTFEAVIQRVYSALAPGGILLFDTAGPGRASAEPKQSFLNRPEWSVLVTAWQKDGVLTREITSFRRLSDCYRRSEETHRLRLIEAKIIQQLLKSLGFEVVQLDRYGDTKLPVGLNAYMALKPKSTNARTNS